MPTHDMTNITESWWISVGWKTLLALQEKSERERETAQPRSREDNDIEDSSRVERVAVERIAVEKIVDVIQSYPH